MPSAGPASASIDAAASAAAHRVLVTLFPARAAMFDALYAAMMDELSESPQTGRGVAWGESVAARILDWRSRDGADAVVNPPAAQ